MRACCSLRREARCRAAPSRWPWLNRVALPIALGGVAAGGWLQATTYRPRHSQHFPRSRCRPAQNFRRPETSRVAAATPPILPQHTCPSLPAETARPIRTLFARARIASGPGHLRRRSNPPKAAPPPPLRLPQLLRSSRHRLRLRGASTTRGDSAGRSPSPTPANPNQGRRYPLSSGERSHTLPRALPSGWRTRRPATAETHGMSSPAMPARFVPRHGQLPWHGERASPTLTLARNSAAEGVVFEVRRALPGPQL